MERHKITCVDVHTDYIEIMVNPTIEQVEIKSEESEDINRIYLDIDKTKELILVLQEALKKIKNK